MSRSSLARPVRAGLLAVLWICAAAAAAPPPKKLAPGTVCVLNKLLPATSAALGKGDKHKMPKGTKLTVHETDKAWTKVTSGDATLFVKAPALLKACTQVSVESGTSAPPDTEAPPADPSGDAPAAEPGSEPPAEKAPKSPAEQA